MDQFLSEISFSTKGEGFTNITPYINKWINENKIIKGILIISINHTSCSLTINENADPDVLKDLSAYMKSIVPEEEVTSISGNGEKYKYLHSQEGIDDMPAHIRTTLTCCNLSLSINNSQLQLGIWQAIYLWEHRYSTNLRKIILHAIGEAKSINKISSNQKISSLIARNNAQKLNKEVMKNKMDKFGLNDYEKDTNVDLLIDRIHELSDDTK